jgi:hypothetical protein
MNARRRRDVLDLLAFRPEIAGPGRDTARLSLWIASRLVEKASLQINTLGLIAIARVSVLFVWALLEFR